MMYMSSTLDSFKADGDGESIASLFDEIVQSQTAAAYEESEHGLVVTIWQTVTKILQSIGSMGSRQYYCL